jgi:hypothetical protein
VRVSTRRGITFDEALWSALDALGAAEGISTAGLIRTACVDLLRTHGVTVELSARDTRARNGRGKRSRQRPTDQ